jgi:hypothetical protein
MGFSPDGRQKYAVPQRKKKLHFHAQQSAENDAEQASQLKQESKLIGPLAQAPGIQAEDRRKAPNIFLISSPLATAGIEIKMPESSPVT